MNLLRPAFCVLRPFGSVRLHQAAIFVLPVIGACSPAGSRSADSAPPLPPITLSADSARTTVVARGVKHHYYWIREGPWAVNVLEIDRAACWTPIALKGRPYAAGREKTSVLLAAYADSARNRDVIVAGGVNADFFSFSPVGVPIGPHIHRGELLTGPVDRPMLAVRRDGSTVLGTLAFSVRAEAKGREAPLTWNHPQPVQLSVVENSFGERTDTATGALEVAVREVDTGVFAGASGSGRRMRGIVVDIDTARSGAMIPRDGFLIFAGARADTSEKAFVQQLVAGDTVQITTTFAEAPPLEAVGGFPMLVRNDTIAAEVHAAGSPGFRGRNPRTAAGTDASGRRLLLVTVDGRQPGYSDGMSLAELAKLMQNLGASDALNLDGGGSTTFVVRDAATKALRIANRPSDREGERPVANALGVEQSCVP